MRKSAFCTCICENQRRIRSPAALPQRLTSAFVFRCLEIKMSQDSKSEFLDTALSHTGLCWNWSEILNTGCFWRLGSTMSPLMRIWISEEQISDQ